MVNTLTFHLVVLCVLSFAPVVLAQDNPPSVQATPEHDFAIHVGQALAIPAKGVVKVTSNAPDVIQISVTKENIAFKGIAKGIATIKVTSASGRLRKLTVLVNPRPPKLPTKSTTP